MISMFWAAAITCFVGAFAFLGGITQGMRFIAKHLLDEGFLLHDSTLGHGRYELFRRNAKGDWVKIISVEQ